jgi:hypothetical protein
MFVFPRVIKSLLDAPESYQPFYKPNEGEGAEGFQLHGDLAAFIQSKDEIVKKERTRAENADKSAKSYRKVFGDDPDAALKKHQDEVKALEDRIAELAEGVEGDGKGDEALKKKLEAQKTQLERTYAKDKLALEKDRDEAKLRADKMSKSVHKHLKQSVVQAAIALHKGKPKVLTPIISQYVKIVEEGDDFVAKVLDEDGDVRRDYEKNTEMVGAEGVARFVGQLKSDPDFVQNFETEPASGSGSRGSQAGTKAADTGKNPFAKDTWNVTQQMLLIKEDRPKAQRLAEAAGQKL